jgi:hypothetical protein
VGVLDVLGVGEPVKRDEVPGIELQGGNVNYKFNTLCLK